MGTEAFELYPIYQALASVRKWTGPTNVSECKSVNWAGERAPL